MRVFAAGQLEAQGSCDLLGHHILQRQQIIARHIKSPAPGDCAVVSTDQLQTDAIRRLCGLDGADDNPIDIERGTNGNGIRRLTCIWQNRSGGPESDSLSHVGEPGDDRVCDLNPQVRFVGRAADDSEGKNRYRLRGAGDALGGCPASRRFIHQETPAVRRVQLRSRQPQPTPDR